MRINERRLIRRYQSGIGTTIGSDMGDIALGEFASRPDNPIAMPDQVRVKGLFRRVDMRRVTKGPAQAAFGLG